jgi:leucyl/phenylalanyl-tRNA---protein transferase
MFSAERDASKVALAALVARLTAQGFTLLDTQYLTEHLAQFGAVEIPRQLYKERLADAITRPAVFHSRADSTSLADGSSTS